MARSSRTAVTLTGPIVEAVGEPLGIGSTALDVWDYAKWPFALALARAMFATLNYLGSFGLFALFVANFGSYDKTHGTLGGIVTLLAWLQITNMSLLFRPLEPRTEAE